MTQYKRKVVALGVTEGLQKPSKMGLLVPIILLALICSAVYFKALFGDFVHDDGSQILQNPWIKDVRHVPDILCKSVWGFRTDLSSNYYRPLMHIIFLIDYHIFGLSPWGFHLVNLLFHAGNSVLVFLLTSRLLDKSSDLLFTSWDARANAFIAAILFAVHPIHTEAVAWVSALPELLYSSFCLLSLYYYMMTAANNQKYAYLFSIIFFSFALLCKEPAATLPILFVGYDIAFHQRLFNANFKKRFGFYLKRYVPYLIILGIYFVVRSAVLGNLVPVQESRGLTMYQCVINSFPLFTQYLGKLLLPTHLKFFYVFHPIHSVLEVKGILGLCVTASYVVLTALACKKSKMVFFCLLMIAVPLLPVLYVPVLGENVFCERYLYFPSTGFSVLSSILFAHVKGMTSRKIAIGVVIGVTVLFSVATMTRNNVWKNEITLYRDSVNKSPESSRMHLFLGQVLLEDGQVEEGNKHMLAASELDPNLWEEFFRDGIFYSEKRIWDKAIFKFITAMKFNPDSAEVHYNLAVAFEEMGYIDQATEHYSVALKLQPNLAVARHRLEAVLESKNAGTKYSLGNMRMPSAAPLQEEMTR